MEQTIKTSSQFSRLGSSSHFIAGQSGLSGKPVFARRLITLTSVCWMFIAGSLQGQDIPAAHSAPEEVHQRLAASGLTTSDIASTFAFALDPRNVRMISLPEVVRETLANNLSIRVTRLDRGIAEDEINVQLGIYDPLLAARVYRVRTDEQSPQIPASFGSFSFSDVSHTNRDAGEIGVSQLTPLGSIFSIQYENANTNVFDSSRASVIHPYYQQRVTFGVVQPLLKNFGPSVTNAGIRIARHQREVSRHGILAQIDAQVAAAMQTYWDLVFAVENLSVQQLYLKQAEDLLRINTVKFNTGVLSQTDVLQAKAQVAAREEQVIIAQSQIIGVQDHLKRLMNVVRDPAIMDRPLIPEDLPRFEPVEIHDAQAVDDALARRPEILRTREYIEISRIQGDVAARQRLPELNLFGNYGISGLGNSSGRAYETMTDNDFNSYQIGVEVKYPLLNRRAKYAHRQSLLNLEKARNQLADLESAVTLEVRNSLRQLRTNLQRIAASRSAVQSEEAKLQSELRRYEVGMATSFEVLTFQKDLANARVAYLNALVDYNKSLIELDRVRAGLRDRLATMGIPIELAEDDSAVMYSSLESPKTP